jgi:hypothetical protein
MAGPSPFILSQRFSQLIGRKVTFVQKPLTLDGKLGQVFGIYSLQPIDAAIVVKSDLTLLGSLAGALVGLPDQAVAEHLRVSPMEELMRDSMCEVLNVAAAAVTTEGRAVFSKMVLDQAYLIGDAEKVYKEPFHRAFFMVSIEGYTGGRFSIYAPFIPTKLANR